jgi:DNA polymerase sigma
MDYTRRTRWKLRAQKIYRAITYRSETRGDKENGGLQWNSRRSVAADQNVQKCYTPKGEQSWSDDRRHLLLNYVTCLQQHFECAQNNNTSKQCIKIYTLKSNFKEMFCLFSNKPKRMASMNTYSLL